LVDYYSQLNIDSVKFDMVKPRSEQYRYSYLGFSYEANMLLSKAEKSNHGFFLKGDFSLKLKKDGQYSQKINPTQEEAQGYFTSDSKSVTYVNQLENGTSWNKFTLGYQFTKSLSEISDLQVKLGYGVLWGAKHPFAGSQIVTLGAAVNFGKRKDSAETASEKKAKYIFKKQRFKYD